MSETTPEAAVAPTAPDANAPTAEQPTEQQPKTFTQDELDRVLADRLNRERAKVSDYADLKAKAEEFDKLTEAQKTEQQKIADRATAAERDRDAARADSLRYKAAAKHGVTEDNFDLLGAGDEEQISARAERVGGFLRLAAENQQLKADLEALRTGKPAQQQPIEQLRPGASPVAVPPIGEADYPSHWFPKSRGDSNSGA